MEDRLNAAEAIFADIAKAGPTIAVFDDLHWADAPSAALFERLAEPEQRAHGAHRHLPSRRHDSSPARGADAARASNAGGRSRTCTSNGSGSPRPWPSSPPSTGGRRRTAWPRPYTPAPAATLLPRGAARRRRRAPIPTSSTSSRCRGASASSCAASSTSSSPTSAASSRLPRCWTLACRSTCSPLSPRHRRTS